MPAHELPIPPAVLADPKAQELVRVWAATGKQHVALATGLWDDPAAWGIMLVDLARHFARAYEQSRGVAVGAVLDRIRKGMDAKWSEDTDPHRLGGLHSEGE
jgi:hypothetical protein